VAKGEQCSVVAKVMKSLADSNKVGGTKIVHAAQIVRSAGLKNCWHFLCRMVHFSAIFFS